MTWLATLASHVQELWKETLIEMGQLGEESNLK